MKTHIIGLLLLLLIPCAAQAQWVLCPNSGEQVHTLVQSGTNIFAGTHSGGVYLSTNNGTTWVIANDEFTKSPIWTIEVSGTNLIAGTRGNGVFLSTDSGKSWTPDGLPNYYVVNIEEIGTSLIAATLGGVFISSNNGTSWTSHNTGLTDTFETCLSVWGSKLYTGTYDHGVFLSTDSGRNWTSDSNGMSIDPINAFATLGTDLFAGTVDLGVFRSSDSGASWIAVNNGLNNYNINALAVNGTNLFAAADGGSIWLSTNRGHSWVSVSTGLTNYEFGSLLVSGPYLFAAAEGGIWRCSLSYFDTLGQSQVAEEQEILSVIQSYPNPFSQSTTINFSSPESGVAEITIINLLGSEVARIFSGEMEAGPHEFSWNACGMPPGMYECIVRMNGSVQRVPIVLMK